MWPDEGAAERLKMGVADWVFFVYFILRAYMWFIYPGENI